MRADGRLVFVAYAAGAERWLRLLQMSDHSLAPLLRPWSLRRLVSGDTRELSRDLDASAVAVVFASRKMLAGLQTSHLGGRLAARQRAGMALLYIPLDKTATEEAVAAALPGASRLTAPRGRGGSLDEASLAMRDIAARIASAIAGRELDRPQYVRSARRAAPPAPRGERPLAYLPPPAAAAAARAPMPAAPASAPVLPGAADEGEDEAEGDARGEGRVVNTWFESDAPLPPFVAGEWYWFYVQIGWPVAGASATPFVEPDFGSHDVLELRAAFFSRDFDVAQGSDVLVLPRVGSSSLVRTRVRPRSEGACRLEVVLSLARELDVLQSLGVVVVVEAATRGAVAVGGAP